MPTMAPIVVEDTTTPEPIEHTFLPMSLDGNIGTYQDSATGTVKSWPKITISVRPSTPANGGHKVILKMTLPVARVSEEGQCCVPIGTALPANLVTVEFLRSNDAQAKDAEDALAYLQQVVQDAQFTAVALGQSLR